MTTAVERTLYYHIAAGYRGSGAVYEVGPWLGGTTSHICAGLDASKHSWHLICIDRFIWNSVYARKWHIDLPEGSSFKHLFAENLAAYRDRMTVLQADVAELGGTGHPIGPVELLFVDAPKSWTTLSRMMSVFGPQLRPGQSTILFQDFLHFGSYPIIWFSLAIPALHPVLAVSDGCSVVMQVKSELGLSSSEYESLHPRHWPLPRLQAKWETFLESVPASRRPDIEGTFALLLFELGYEREARAYAKAITWSAKVHAMIKKLHSQISNVDAKKTRKYTMLLEAIAETGLTAP